MAGSVTSNIRTGALALALLCCVACSSFLFGLLNLEESDFAFLSSVRFSSSQSGGRPWHAVMPPRWRGGSNRWQRGGNHQQAERVGPLRLGIASPHGSLHGCYCSGQGSRNIGVQHHGGGRMAGMREGPIMSVFLNRFAHSAGPFGWAGRRADGQARENGQNS